MLLSRRLGRHTILYHQLGYMTVGKGSLGLGLRSDGS
jgi:hypothetical protein